MSTATHTPPSLISERSKAYNNFFGKEFDATFKPKGKTDDGIITYRFSDMRREDFPLDPLNLYITSGMSDRDQPFSDVDCSIPKRIELAAYVPKWAPCGNESTDAVGNLLTLIAIETFKVNFPFTQTKVIDFGGPLLPGSDMHGVLVMDMILVDDGKLCKMSKADAVFQLVGLSRREIDLYLSQGIDALLDYCESIGLPMVLDPKRPCLLLNS